MFDDDWSIFCLDKHRDYFKRCFAKADLNGDGFIDLEEAMETNWRQMVPGVQRDFINSHME